MPAGYVIAQLRVNNPENYKEYIEKVNPIVKKFDGEFLVRNGAVSYTHLTLPTKA